MLRFAYNEVMEFQHDNRALDQHFAETPRLVGTRQLIERFSNIVQQRFSEREQRVQISDALELMVELHDGQLDWEDKPYANHPLRIALGLLESHVDVNCHDVIAALLHDAAEDQAGKIVILSRAEPQNDLVHQAFIYLAERYSPEPIALVHSLTNPAPTGPAATWNDQYHEHIKAIAQTNPRAFRIKLQDLLDNTPLNQLDPALIRPHTRGKYGPVLLFAVEYLEAGSNPFITPDESAALQERFRIIHGRDYAVLPDTHGIHRPLS